MWTTAGVSYSVRAHIHARAPWGGAGAKSARHLLTVNWLPFQGCIKQLTLNRWE
jgi:hypothetical protein